MWERVTRGDGWPTRCIKHRRMTDDFAYSGLNSVRQVEAETVVGQIKKLNYIYGLSKKHSWT